MVYEEHAQQSQVFTWWRMMQRLKKIPANYLLYANRNTQRMTMIQASRAKAEGLVKGVPDMFLAVPNKGHHGLYIELKAPRLKPKTSRAILGGLTKVQYTTIESLRSNHYKVAIAYSSKDAISEIQNYLGLNNG